MAQLFKNNAFASLAADLLVDGTSLTLASGQGSRFPLPGSGDHFLLTLAGLDANAAENAWEIVKCTNRNTDTLTIQRAQEATVAREWPAGTRVELRLTAGSLLSFGGGSTQVANAASYTYNPAGQVTQTVETFADAHTRTTTIAYHANGNINTVTIVENGKTRTETYTYDASGTVTGMTATEV